MRLRNTSPKAIALRVVSFLAAFLISGAVYNYFTNNDASYTDIDRTPFTSEKYEFSAEFPEEPVAEEQTIPVQGANIVQTLFSSELGNDKYFGISAADYPDQFDMSDTLARLNGALDGSAQGVENGEVVSRFFEKVGEYDAIDGVITATESGQEVTLRIRNILVGQRLYSITTVNATTAEQKAFVESFQLQQ